MDALIVRAGALGDVLLLRSAVASLREAGHRVRLLAPAGPGRVLVGPGGVDALVPLDGAEMAGVLGGETPEGELEVALRADAVLALSRSVDLISTLRRFAGRLVHRDPDPPPGVHAADWFAEAAREIGGRAPQRLPPLRFSVEERRAAATVSASLPPRFLAIHPGSGAAAKNWPAERFARLASSRTAGGGRWLLVAGPADREAVASLQRVPGAVVAECLPSRVLGAVLSAAGLYVGNDSGVSHLAAAAGAPTLALFGPTDPVSWAPRGPLVATLRSPDGTMAGLHSAAVEQAAADLERA